ncbi:hypothetical protein B0189_10960 [Moraxella cuniculi]|nr:hypothetical protein B0189_10960 [Moraxella cuniculi]
MASLGCVGWYYYGSNTAGIITGGAGIILPIADLLIKHTKNIKTGENGENGKMTPTKLDISRLCRFPPILGKWENGEGKGKMGDYHACPMILAKA